MNTHTDYEDRTDPTGAGWDREAEAADDRRAAEKQARMETIDGIRSTLHGLLGLGSLEARQSPAWARALPAIHNALRDLETLR